MAGSSCGRAQHDRPREGEGAVSIHRKDAKRDANEPEIVAALEMAGARVRRMSQPGVPDLRVYFRERLFDLEVKEQKTKKPPKDRAKLLTKAQLEYAKQFPVAIVLTPNEALEAIGSALRIENEP
jgi:hypothetical protein